MTMDENNDEVDVLLTPRLAVPFQARSPLRSSLIKHGTRHSKSPGRKTVSFVSQNNEKRISNVNDCWQCMQQGCELVKLRANVRQFRRFFSLDADLSHIRWTPTNKKPHKARIAVDSIREIRVGRNTELLRTSENVLTDLQEECAFSVIYGDDYECLDLIAPTADDANIWVTGLMALTSNKYDCKPSSSLPMATLRERWLESVFEEADVEKKGWLSEKTAVRTMRALDTRLLLSRIKHKVKELASMVAENEKGRLTKQQFVEIYKEIATRPEVYFLMVRYANKDYLTVQDLRLFLETEQGMVGVTSDFCENLIDQYEPSPEAKQNNYMTVDGFTRYLQCSDCAAFDPAHSRVCQDMKAPFAHYFIAASHNTYLVEDQLNGPSSTDGYLSALKRNCRFIELDLWDPHPSAGEEEPMIYHGGTKTSRLKLSDALRTIHETAFERTRYPLLIRLENHLSAEWQYKAVTLLKEILGSKLYKPADDPAENASEDANSRRPSPYDYQMKIILCGAKLVANSKEEHEVSEEDESYENTNSSASKSKKTRKITLIQELSDLIPRWMQSKQLKDLLSTAPNSTSLNPKQHWLSLNEGTCLRLMHTYPAEFTAATREYSTRVIPNSSRTDSSNLNPQEFWNYGIQLVALNYQTPGLMMDLQEGKFSANGGCGYVLKPAVMKDDLFTPGDKLPFAPQILHLRVLSGQQLPRPRGSTAKGDSADPFVVVEIFGVPADCAEERTRTVRNDSVCPAFDESFQFQVSVPELALVRFLVLDDDFIGDDFIGQYTIPFDCLQPGYRHIQLLNNEGDPLENASLFVHIAITNRRGGGKAKKRGMSVKRKTQRVHTGLKVVGVKTVDDLFKVAVGPLSESITLRNDLETAMVEWQEECGLGPAGTIRQGLRLIHSRMITLAVNSSPPSTPSGTEDGDKSNDTNSTPAPSFFVDANDKKMPIVNTQGQIPEQLQKTFTSLRTLLTRCSAIIEQGDDLLVKIEDAMKTISENCDDISKVIAEAGVRGQKAIRASENFTWNQRLLKAQIALIGKGIDEATDTVAQVFDTADVLGILSEKLVAVKANNRRMSRISFDPGFDTTI